MKTWQILLTVVVAILAVRYVLSRSRSKRAHELVEAGALLLDDHFNPLNKFLRGLPF